MHRLPDSHVLTPTLLRRFEAETEIEDGGDMFHAIVQTSDGHFKEFTGGLPIRPEQAVFARKVLYLVNKELNFGGAWVAVFTNPEANMLHALAATVKYERIVFIWLDEDGDPQFSHDWFEPESDQGCFEEMMLEGRNAWGDYLNASWQTYRENRRAQDIRPDQQYRRALGEQAPSIG